jgi:hypothetical protein
MIPILLLAASLTAPPDDAVRLAVQPMAAPKPALKYQLLPEVRELVPGNPVQWYLRCFAEQRNFFFGKDGVAQRVKYQKMTLEELAREKLDKFGGSALTQADYGARLDTPDWQVLERVQTEGADLAQPEIAPLRLLGESLQIRFRTEVARKDFAAAVGTAKTMLTLARHMGENPTPAANLVGLAIANMAFDTLEEMVAQPGCPNLYWALTDLPGSLVDIRKGLQGHRAQVDAELRAVRDDPMTAAELDEVLGSLAGRASFARVQAGLPPLNLRATLTTRAKDADRLRAARKRLADAGLKEALVETLPPLQVVLLDEKRAFEVRRDEEMKLVSLPPLELEALARGPKAELNVLFADLMPRVASARHSQARVEQRVAVLRHVEALRMYAAAHGGELPAKLADAGVPLPPDVFTGKPFEYELKDGVARLVAGTPTGNEKKLRYEIGVK